MIELHLLYIEIIFYSLIIFKKSIYIIILLILTRRALLSMGHLDAVLAHIDKNHLPDNVIPNHKPQRGGENNIGACNLPRQSC